MKLLFLILVAMPVSAAFGWQVITGLYLLLGLSPKAWLGIGIYHGLVLQTPHPQTWHLIALVFLFSFRILTADYFRLWVARLCTKARHVIFDLIKCLFHRIFHITFITSSTARHIVSSLLVFVILHLSIGCSKESLKLTVLGSLQDSVTSVQYREFDEMSTIEASTLWIDGLLSAFIDPDFSGTFRLKQRNASGQWEFKTITEIGYARFHYTFEHDGTLYTIAQKGIGIYIWSSPDGIIWNVRNSGLPILTGSQDGASLWHQMWNVSIAIDAGGIAHLFCECSNGTSGQGAVGLTYARTAFTPDSLDFNAVKGSVRVIVGGGNSYVTVRQDGSALLFYGASARGDSDFGNYWFVTYATAPAGSDFGDPESWNERQDRLKIGSKGAHVADPHWVDLGAGSGLLTLSFDQVNSIGITLNITEEEL